MSQHWLAKLLEDESQAEGDGKATRYSRAVGDMKKRKTPRKEAFENDGRAPDTNNHLPTTTSTSSDKEEAAKAAPQNTHPSKKRSRNNPTSAFASVRIQSWQHYRNTCYITSALECLWAAYLPLRKHWLGLQPQA
ncbi:hypothetical protein CF319_g4533 [Tilletia indica]|nr:hypothetical protein CF319_g4533 [Tilletia indica]